MNSGIAPMGVRERSSCSFSRCRSLMVFTGSGATSDSSAAGFSADSSAAGASEVASSVADSSATTAVSAGCSAAGVTTSSTFAVFSTVSTFAVFSTTADSAAFFSATSNRLSRVEATSASDTAGAATFGAGACLALALRRLVRPVAIASSRGTSEAFSFFGRPGRRRSVPC